MEQLTGKQLGPYRIIGPLGAGGMAAVYQAYQPGMDRYVALKILPRHLAQDPQFVARFQHEAKIIASLQHPHILPVFDFGEADGYTYLVMPFIANGTLADTLRGQPLPNEQVRRIIAQVGDALDYAHSSGIIHRDVKPSNVLLDGRGNCLLTDFGIAKIVAGTVQLTLPGGIIGTPAYMSPEQGQGGAVDQRSDIYALGVLLYELTTGRVPFTAETPLAIVLKHLHDPLPPPRTRNPSLSEALERTILKALAKEPGDRYQTAAELVRALQATMSGESGRAAPLPVDTLKLAPPDNTHTPPAQPPLTPIPQRRAIAPWLIPGAIGMILLAAIALGGLFLRTLSATPEPTPPAQALVATAPDSAGARLPTSSVQATAPLAVSPDAATALPTPSVEATAPLVVTPELEWIAIGGTWSGPDDGVVHGETDVSDGLYLYQQIYTDFTFAAEVQAEDREASLAFRMQDDQNGYLVIVVPTGALGGNPGVYLAKRLQGGHSFLAASQQHSPAVGQWIAVSVRTAGTRIQVSMNGTLVLDVSDTSTTPFTSGKVGFRIYGDSLGPCHANFRNIQLPAKDTN
jgi:serine/threonine protein kinase